MANVLFLTFLKPRAFDYAPNLNSIITGTENEKGGSSKNNNGLAKSGGSGLLDTFSLSFVGNLNFSNAIHGVQKIIEGIASCKCSVEAATGLSVSVEYSFSRF